jgi:fluoroacetyl-CoA thioesterase
MSTHPSLNRPRLEPGLTGHFEAEVRREWTIAHYDPRLPAVLSTPAMIGMMETAAARAVDPTLPVGKLTVGTRIEVEHSRAVACGARIVANARLTEVRGRFLVFEVEARCGDQVIGQGRVTRAIVDYARFAQIAAGGESIPE